MESRRSFFRRSALLAGAAAATPAVLVAGETDQIKTKPHMKDGNLFFDISLAEWSLHRKLKAGNLDNLDFPGYASEKFDINAVEYVNTFFQSAGLSYARQLLQRTEDLGVRNVLIMIDGEGNLGDLSEVSRKKSVENHYKWVECAQELGCHSIRVNARGDGSPGEIAWAAVRSLRELSLFAADYGINVIVENHGGYSSRGSWLADVISRVGMVNCGTLPDFGNFKVSEEETYDIYLGVKEMMPFAKGVSAKSHDFDAEGNETEKDYVRLLDIVRKAGYRGYIGIEYEGNRLSEDEGILATKKLLIKAASRL